MFKYLKRLFTYEDDDTIKNLQDKVRKIEGRMELMKNYKSMNSSVEVALNTLPISYESILHKIVDCVNLYLHGEKIEHIFDDFLFNNYLDYKKYDDMNVKEMNVVLQKHHLMYRLASFVSNDSISVFYKAFMTKYKDMDLDLRCVYPWTDSINDIPNLDKLMKDADTLYTELEKELLDYSNIIIGRIDNKILNVDKGTSDNFIVDYDTSINAVYSNGYNFAYTICAIPRDDNDGLIPFTIDSMTGLKTFKYFDSEKEVFNLAMIKLIFTYLV